MKKLYSIFLLIFVMVQVHAQMIATTADGRKVILYANGTWIYIERNNSCPGSTDFLALYNEAYQYAYDVVYDDEFFSHEKTNKAVAWATDYVSKMYF